MAKPEVSLLVATAKPKFFYGYTVVIAGLIASVFIIGSYFSFGVFFKPLSSEFGWARATTSAAVSVASLVMGFANIAAGRLTDRYGPRLVLILCGLSMGLGILLMSRITALWQLYLFYGVLVGIGMSAADVPIIATVARWFVKRRGMMTGITKVGAGLGIMGVPLLASWLISSYGWRDAYAILGIIVLVGIISVALFFKRDPAQIGELPDGVTEALVIESAVSPRQFSLREAMATHQFRLFSVAWFGFMFTSQVVIVHLVPHATDLGISPTIAATIITAIGGFSIFGRLGLASLSDILGPQKVFMITFALLAAALLWVQFATEVWMFYIFAALYGIAHGACFSLLSLMMARLFGLALIGTILGIILFIGTFGSLLGPTLAGWIFDIMGNYRLAFWIAFVFNGVGLVLIALLKPTGSEGGNK
ncbi:MAG: MFS transporter [Chloroflexi bacterium]|nr:MFS transporter [Chloroflexota bacterium]